MRIWLHGSTKSAAFSPGAAVSIVAHAALIGGALLGTSRASAALRKEVEERIYFLPPPDRIPSSHRSDARVRYVPPGAGAKALATRTTAGPPAGQDSSPTTRAVQQAGVEEASQALLPSIASTDSVYSVMGVDQAAVRDESSGAPIYPMELLAQHVEGDIAVRYVVDSTGRTEAGSVEVLRATNPAFVGSVQDALTRMHFTPGTVAGRRVRQAVEQEFRFRITAPLPATVAEHTRATPPA